MRGEEKLGVGQPPDAQAPYTGCCGDDPEVWRFIQAGSPRLALARATGIPLVPLIINVRATFPSTSTVDVPTVGAQTTPGGQPWRMVQDCLMDSMVFGIYNKSATANQNVEQSESDYYFGLQSGIEATLTVEGQPRYQVCSYFTPLSQIANMVRGENHWPYGWILKPTQQLLMSFHAGVPLPYAPIEVVCSFRMFSTVSDGDIPGNRQAFDTLRSIGYSVPDAVVNQICR